MPASPFPLPLPLPSSGQNPSYFSTLPPALPPQKKRNQVSFVGTTPLHLLVGPEKSAHSRSLLFFLQKPSSLSLSLPVALKRRERRRRGGGLHGWWADGRTASPSKNFFDGAFSSGTFHPLLPPAVPFPPKPSPLLHAPNGFLTAASGGMGGTDGGRETALPSPDSPFLAPDEEKGQRFSEKRKSTEKRGRRERKGREGGGRAGETRVCKRKVHYLATVKHRLAEKSEKGEKKREPDFHPSVHAALLYVHVRRFNSRGIFPALAISRSRPEIWQTSGRRKHALFT